MSPIATATASRIAPAQEGVEARTLYTVFGLRGPEVLACAADIAPEVVSQLPCYADIQAVLYEALCRLRMGRSRHHRLGLADEVRDMLAVYLVETNRARPELRLSATVRGWVVNRDLAGVRTALAGAARYWRRELDRFASPDAERSI